MWGPLWLDDTPLSSTHLQALGTPVLREDCHGKTISHKGNTQGEVRVLLPPAHSTAQCKKMGDFKKGQAQRPFLTRSKYILLHGTLGLLEHRKPIMEAGQQPV
jgi:hypothetical protein